jgi:hypothetical protein
MFSPFMKRTNKINTEARGDDDVFLSSSLEREYVSLEGCGIARKA